MCEKSHPCCITYRFPCFNLISSGDLHQSMIELLDDYLTPVQKAFSKQATHYDQDDSSNPILLDWRKKVYTHVNQFLKPGNRILELNAGTGIDALHFVNAGH